MFKHTLGATVVNDVDDNERCFCCYSDVVIVVRFLHLGLFWESAMLFERQRWFAIVLSV